MRFEGGVNIAIKIPLSKYKKTVAFYKDVLKLNVTKVEQNHPTVQSSHKVEFGKNFLWLDCVPHATHSETWLEIRTDSMDEAVLHLQKNGTQTCDELEKIPEGMHWIQDPAGTVFILDQVDNP